ncbi:SlyX family protein [Piscirickettsia litoralis]|uniref:Protein SlyX homolog n=1 Tax=Piscirickettsia litoralis TaxID=1891921 RepID=A0ABX3A851_9GAMM|nr:SlyX family protein [Piscirickettsia litoralis]ODN43823.1 slyX family protein [Piscirickettsia litoralis]
MSLENRLTELETKFVFQEDLVSQLNQVIIRQQGQLDQLMEELKQLKSKLAAQFSEQSSNFSDPLQERPPHY